VEPAARSRWPTITKAGGGRKASGEVPRGRVRVSSEVLGRPFRCGRPPFFEVTSDQAHLPAQEAISPARARFPAPHAHRCRGAGHPRSPAQGPPPAHPPLAAAAGRRAAVETPVPTARPRRLSGRAGSRPRLLRSHPGGLRTPPSGPVRSLPGGRDGQPPGAGGGAPEPGPAARSGGGAPAPAAR